MRTPSVRPTRIFSGVVVLGGLLFATAAAVIRQPTWHSSPFEGTARADAARLREHVRFLTTDVRPRSAERTDNLDRAANYIAVEFRRAGARVSEQIFQARRRRYQNVIAEFGPADPSVPLLIVGAHYDAFASTGDLPGADDNASATAGLLELARLLGYRAPARPVDIVAFSTEEPPFFGSDEMGSAVHANALAEQRRAVAGMICLEMIGYYTKVQPWPSWVLELMYPRSGDFIAVAGGWHDRSLTRLVKNSIRGAGGIRVYSFTGPHEMLDASDQRNYWRYGWPAVMVTDTAYVRNPNYHTKGDTADKLDYTKMARVVDGIFNAVRYATSR